ncbi:aldehyde dehydrogenase family protein [Cryobacterium melibiosiphilum]|uniref:Aldehyde dehydrogenase family protein n=1 Tax=Cryobacterium melibiosiphilum TaxID=995039 RepID=A0A3A5MH76_9MICO|nr:aldehyde dehydrogenase family protein [Cryobacterium melibiosiphilum]RJT89497.1 aldehyde dehydrogenase family protein [Cryobacterium melibiosiphilum]
MTIYSAPGTPDALITFKPRYENWINGQWTPPVNGEYFGDISPVNGKQFTEVALGTPADIELALDAAHAAAPAWGKTSSAERAAVLNRIADVIDANRELLSVTETWDNGKPVRENLAADIPLAADHFRYFAAAIRAQDGDHAELDGDNVSYQFHEPLGVVGQIIPWNFPILMASWKLAPALAAGNAIVLKPASQTPVSILVLIELIGDILPAGVLNIVNGYGSDAGAHLASSPRIRKIAFTGSTPVGRTILKAASENIIPSTVELGGKSPNLFFADVAQEDDAFYNKAQEGFVLFALNQGEICAAPTRALVQKSIYDTFVTDAVARTKLIKQGNPLDTETQMGAQASKAQYDKVLSYIEIGKQEGAKLLLGGEGVDLGGELSGGFYIQPTIFEGDNSMRIFQEEIFGPVLAVTSFEDYADAIEIANDSEFGLAAGVWSRNGNVAYRASRDLEAGRVWVNNYHTYPAGAAFGGYKNSGIGRENNKLALGHYQQTKNTLVSYSENALGFF